MSVPHLAHTYINIHMPAYTSTNIHTHTHTHKCVHACRYTINIKGPILITFKDCIERKVFRLQSVQQFLPLCSSSSCIMLITSPSGTSLGACPKSVLYVLGYVEDSPPTLLASFPIILPVITLYSSVDRLHQLRTMISDPVSVA